MALSSKTTTKSTKTQKASNKVLPKQDTKVQQRIFGAADVSPSSIPLNVSDFRDKLERIAENSSLRGRWHKLGAETNDQLNMTGRDMTDVSQESAPVQNNFNVVTKQISILSNFIIKLDYKFRDFESTIQQTNVKIATEIAKNQITLVNQVNKQLKTFDSTIDKFQQRVDTHDRQLDEIYAQVRNTKKTSAVSTFLERRQQKNNVEQYQSPIKNTIQQQTAGVVERSAGTILGAIATRALAVPALIAGATAGVVGAGLYAGGSYLFGGSDKDKSNPSKNSTDEIKIVSSENILIESKKKIELKASHIILNADKIEFKGKVSYPSDRTSISDENQSTPKTQQFRSGASSGSRSSTDTRSLEAQSTQPKDLSNPTFQKFSPGASSSGGVLGYSGSGSATSAGTSDVPSAPKVSIPKSALQNITEGISSGSVAINKGRVDKSQYKSLVMSEIKKQGLDKLTPKDMKKYGIDGTPESWANLLMSLTNAESGFKPKADGDHGMFDGGSHGMFQLSKNDSVNYKLNGGKPFTMEQLQDPATNVKAAIAIMKKQIQNKGSIRAGAGSYWGPIKRDQLQIEDYSGIKTASDKPMLPGITKVVSKAEQNYNLLERSAQKRANAKIEPDRGNFKNQRQFNAALGDYNKRNPNASVTPENNVGGQKYNINDNIGSLKNTKRNENTRTSDMFRVGGKTPFNYGISQAAREEFGELGTNLTSIKLSNNKSLTVNKAVEVDMKGFLEEAMARGYDINDIGGYAFRRNVNNPSKMSTHASGGTVDLNSSRNPNNTNQTDMPEGMKKLAMKYGFAQLGNDKMHFERVPPNFRGEYIKRLLEDGTLNIDDPIVKQRISEGLLDPKDLQSISQTSSNQPPKSLKERSLTGYSGIEEAKKASTDPNYFKIKSAPAKVMSKSNVLNEPDKKLKNTTSIRQGPMPIVKPKPQMVAGATGRTISMQTDPKLHPRGAMAAANKNAVQEKVKDMTPTESAKAARGGAYAGGGIKARIVEDAPKKQMQPRGAPTATSTKSETSSQTTSQKPMKEPKGEQTSSYDNSGDSIPPGPSDSGYGDYKNCLV